jgi:transglutaminase-like putative cysteine protease
MATYRIHHLTRYSYDEPVSVCHNLAHLLPRVAPAPPRHAWRQAEIDISPAPAVRAERIDFFGNRLTFFAIQEPHRELEVVTKSEVALDPFDAPPLFSTTPWELVRDGLNGPRPSPAAAPAAPFASQPLDRQAEWLDAFQFTFASPYIRWTPAVAEYARPSFASGRPLMESILELTARIHKDFRYDTKSTTVSTTLPEILAARAGVCQDFAHLQIGCLRAMGLAARYVSGYLLTTPPPGRPRLVGADASHAWVSVYLPDAGWLDLDPTNNLIPSDKHITLAWGRDFGDVSPLRGVILGGGRHHIHVSVDVSPI